MLVSAFFKILTKSHYSSHYTVNNNKKIALSSPTSLSPIFWEAVIDALAICDTHHPTKCYFLTLIIIKDNCRSPFPLTSNYYFMLNVTIQKHNDQHLLLQAFAHQKQQCSQLLHISFSAMSRLYPIILCFNKANCIHQSPCPENKKKCIKMSLKGQYCIPLWSTLWAAARWLKCSISCLTITF